MWKVIQAACGAYSIFLTTTVGTMSKRYFHTKSTEEGKPEVSKSQFSAASISSTLYHVTCSINLSISTKETWKLHSGGVFTYFLQQLSRNKGLHEPNGISKITNRRSTGPS